MDLNAQLKSGEAEGKENLEIDSRKTPKKPSKLFSDDAPQPKDISPRRGKAPLKINFKAVFNWVIFFVIIIVLVYIGYLCYGAFTYQPTSTVEEVKLSDDEAVIQRIDSSIEPGKEVSTSESGYGRSDPFKRY